MGNKKEQRLIKYLGLLLGIIGLYEVFGKMLWDYEQSRKFIGFDYTIILTCFTMVFMVGSILLIEIFKDS